MPKEQEKHAVKEAMLAWVDRNMQAIFDLNDCLFSFGEPSLEEYETAALITSILEDAGFDVERGISGFPTAFVATYGQGAPVVALHAEYDATPGGSQRGNVAEPAPIVPGAPGHAEGHQANATVMTATALAIKRMMLDGGMQGTLKVFGAPGEELAVSRPYFVRDGYFDDVDAAFHNHIRDSFYTEVGQTQISLISAEFTFTGESTHAGLTPWKGKDALDAVVLMDCGMAQLREHIQPEMRSHRIFTQAGEQPNVIPSVASAWWYFRGHSAQETHALYERACAVAQGAALMTDTKLLVEIKSAVWPTRCNRVLAEVLEENMLTVGMPVWSDEEVAFAKKVQVAAGLKIEGLRTGISPTRGPDDPEASSNDCGDISWKVPMGRLWFPGSIPNVQFHHWSGGCMLTTSITHKGSLAAVKVLAGSVFDVMNDSDLLVKVKKSFQGEIAGSTYVPLIPRTQEPRLSVHEDLMKHFRPIMRQHYRTERALFTS